MQGHVTVPPCWGPSSASLQISASRVGAGWGAEATMQLLWIQACISPRQPPGHHPWASHPSAALTALPCLPQQAWAHAGFPGAGQDPWAEGPALGRGPLGRGAAAPPRCFPLMVVRGLLAFLGTDRLFGHKQTPQVLAVCTRPGGPEKAESLCVGEGRGVSLRAAPSPEGSGLTPAGLDSLSVPRAATCCLSLQGPVSQPTPPPHKQPSPLPP